jgi:hypothetical protein
VTGDATRAITVLETLAIQRILQGPPDTLTLHAALVARGHRGILVLGPSQAGKSTLSCGLWRRGWSLIGDDVTLIDPATATARSAPRRVSLRHGSRQLLDPLLWDRMLAAPSTEPTSEGYLFHPSEVGDNVPRQVTLQAFVFLRRSGVAVPAAPRRLLHEAEVALALMPYSNLIRRMDADAVIRAVAPLASRVPAYDLGRASLDDMTTAMTQIVEQGQ